MKRESKLGASKETGGGGVGGVEKLEIMKVMEIMVLCCTLARE